MGKLVHGTLEDKVVAIRLYKTALRRTVREARITIEAIALPSAKLSRLRVSSDPCRRSCNSGCNHPLPPPLLGLSFGYLCEALDMHTPGVDVSGVIEAVSMTQVYADKEGNGSFTESRSYQGYQVE